MEAYEAIISRRSIRKYIKKTLPSFYLEKLLTAAMAAPSAGNQQPWHFIVISDRSILDEIPNFHPHSQMLYEAPLAILVCADTQLETHLGCWVEDCSAATQNILLAAHALGLGAVWLGIYLREERTEAIRKMLKLPESVMPLSLIAVGFPAEKKPPASRYNENRIHYNEW
ncbi:MAG: nitroreductase family protein [Dehalococcoidia bacterium]|nr:MAG: nitroreductase family protein [Dehalococcoidia bacterium]